MIGACPVLYQTVPVTAPKVTMNHILPGFYINRELRRRTRVVGIFPNVASCLRLVSAVAMEISDAWEAGRSYVPTRS